MSYTLQTSGLAAIASSIIAVDSDGVTIRDFVSPTRTTNMTVNSNVIKGSSTWKGVSRGYFQTLANGTYGFYGLTFASGYEIPYDCSSGKAAAIFIAHAGASNDPGGLAAIMTESTVSGGIKLTSGNLLSQFFTGGTSATAIPVDGTTKFSFGTSFTYGGASTYYYGLESGSLSQDATATDGGYGANRPLSSIGGAAGQGNRPAKHHLIAVFPRALTLAEHQSLHNDWFGTLFQTAATTTTLTGPTSGSVGTPSTNFTVGADGTISGTVVVTPGDGGAGGTFTPTTVSISSGTPTGTFTYTPASSGAKTISTTNNGSLSNPSSITYTASGGAGRLHRAGGNLSGLGSAGPFFQNPLQ